MMLDGWEDFIGLKQMLTLTRYPVKNPFWAIMNGLAGRQKRTTGFR